MSKKMILLFLLGALPGVVLPQSKRNELTAGYGLYASTQAIERSASISTKGLSTGMTSIERIFTGSFHVGYRYRDDITQHLPMTVGVAFMYEQALSNAFVGDIATGRFNDSFYTVLGEMNIIYCKKHRFMLYCVMGAGFTFCTREFASNKNETDTVNIIHLNFQLSPVSIQYGENAGVFLECGLGSKGSVCAGIFVRL